MVENVARAILVDRHLGGRHEIEKDRDKVITEKTITLKFCQTLLWNHQETKQSET